MIDNQDSWKCSLCEQSYPGTITLGGTCTEPGCPEPICNNCWALRGRRFCRWHSTAALSQVAPTEPPPETPEPIDKGKSRITVYQAKSLELCFIGRFDLNVQRILSTTRSSGPQAKFTGISHTTSDKLNELRRLPECRQPVSELKNLFPLNTASSYHLRVKNSPLFSSRQDIVLEGQSCARFARYLKQGYDDQPITLDELAAIVAALTSPVSLQTKKEYRVTGIFSPTGWDRAANGFICGAANALPFAHSCVSLCLVGPNINELRYSSSDGRMKAFALCFEGKTLAEEVAQCKSKLKQAFSPGGYISIEDFTTSSKIDPPVIQQACDELVREEPAFELVKLKPLGEKILRIKDIAG